jgi:hypothetical protein
MASVVGLDVATSDAQKTILVMMSIVIVAVTVEKLSQSNEDATATGYVKTYVAAAVATCLLEALSYVLPEFAIGLSVVAVTTVVISKGKPFWAAIANVTGSGSKTLVPVPVTPGTNTVKPEANTSI